MAGEIAVSFQNLDAAVAALRELASGLISAGGADPDIGVIGTVGMRYSAGDMASNVEDAYFALQQVEARFAGLVGKTMQALVQAGIQFKDADELMASLLRGLRDFSQEDHIVI